MIDQVTTHRLFAHRIMRKSAEAPLRTRESPIIRRMRRIVRAARDEMADRCSR